MYIANLFYVTKHYAHGSKLMNLFLNQVQWAST